MKYQLSRRSFLYATMAITLSQLLSSCSDSNTSLQILFLANSIPLQLISDFRRAIGKVNKVDFKPQTQLNLTFDSLQQLSSAKEIEKESKNLLNTIFNESKKNPDIITLGDSWLSLAIQQNLLQPLDIKSLANWEKLPSAWQKLVQRNGQGNITKNGDIWAAPYRWGSTVIAYQSDKLDDLGLTIADWQDLWNPQLTERISLLDSPREIIGLTLKKLGYSYNTKSLDSIANLESELLALHQQAKLYSSDHYLEPLILGDTWVAVAWSTDILPIVKNYPEIKFVIPQSGTALWADLWVKPRFNHKIAANNEHEALINQWIDFCWESKAAQQISLFTKGMSPVVMTMNSTDLPEDLQDNVFLNSEVLKSEQSEFLSPLTKKTQQQYRDMWLKIRQSS